MQFSVWKFNGHLCKLQIKSIKIEYQKMILYF